MIPVRRSKNIDLFLLTFKGKICFCEEVGHGCNCVVSSAIPIMVR